MHIQILQGRVATAWGEAAEFNPASSAIHPRMYQWKNY